MKNFEIVIKYSDIEIDSGIDTLHIQEVTFTDAFHHAKRLADKYETEIISIKRVDIQK